MTLPAMTNANRPRLELADKLTEAEITERLNAQFADGAPRTEAAREAIAAVAAGIAMQRACTSDACAQGHKPCPTPAACRLPEADDGIGWRVLAAAGMAGTALWLAEKMDRASEWLTPRRFLTTYVVALAASMVVLHLLGRL